MSSISIIIPTYNETSNILPLLEHLLTYARSQSIKEIIITDGGSTDDTVAKVETLITQYNRSGRDNAVSTSRPDLIVSHAPKGRPLQMNHGAALAQGDILYFLHADTFPPEGYDTAILNTYEHGHKAGCFSMRFDSKHWWLRLAGWLTQFNWKACRGGDQSLFIDRYLFQQLKGFNENFVIYEDIELINKLYVLNEFVVIPKWVTTSARRYRTNGIWKLQRHFWTIYVKKWFGATAEELHQYYIKHIH